MGVLDVLDERCIGIGYETTKKPDALREIAHLVKNSDLLQDVPEDAIFAALSEREKTGTTGFGDGVAIPHCSFPNLDGFVVGLVTYSKGLDFDSVDGKKVSILVFIVGPSGERNRHIQILSAVSKLLLEKDTIRRIRRATVPSEVATIVKGESVTADEPVQKREKCLFQIITQREEYFDQVIQILSAEVQGEIAVLEANNAGYYLNRIPLFAAYWGEEKSRFTRLILAVTDKSACNDVIRRISLISDDLDREKGILVTVQDLVYVGGSLDF